MCTILEKEQRGNLGELAEDVLGKANGLQTRVDRDRREVSSEHNLRRKKLEGIWLGRITVGEKVNGFEGRRRKWTQVLCLHYSSSPVE